MSMIRNKLVGRNSSIIHNGDMMWCQNIHAHKNYVKHIVSISYMKISILYIPIPKPTNSFQYTDKEASVKIFLSLCDFV